MDISAAQHILRDYGNFLELRAPLPGCVADVKHLPHSKQRIKDAIGQYVISSGEQAVREELKHGYLMLSAWQNNVGEETLGLDFAQLDLDEDPQLVAEKIQRQSASIGRWKSVIEADQSKLMAEFERLCA
jgi:hypothetical protein